MSELKLGPGQMKVMRLLWEKKRATTQEIIDVLNESEPVKHSTVQTFLRTLVRKGAAAYDVEKRTYIFYPLVKEEEVKQHAFKDFVDHAFAGSMEGFVSFFVKNKFIPPEELKKIQEQIEEKEK